MQTSFLGLHPGWLLLVCIANINTKARSIYRAFTGPEFYLAWLFFLSRCGYPSDLPLDDIKFTADLARKLNPLHTEGSSAFLINDEMHRNSEIFASYFTDTIEGVKVRAVWEMEGAGDSKFVYWARRKATLVLKYHYDATRKTEDDDFARTDGYYVPPDLQPIESDLVVKDELLQRLVRLYKRAAEINTTYRIGIPRNTSAATV
ncbi:hypothetical protein BDP27DRAFT_1413706 [Rhodocollybia butyracea]|uniref:Uncharacterized protein n=1 Tax=Rhodocollybia butyracea TaxID=206335 RepID=A0A9P5UEI0_9AGAR|nr:hypothetical protein BDP27DRAFT_1413706 [Rhodocollybia butyracea]